MSVEAKNYEGRTAMHHSAEAEIGVKDDQGQIVSHVATFSDSSEAVLLKPAADIQKKCVTRN